MVDRLTEVKGYIDDNILHSELWDKATETRQKKAVNNASKVILNVLSDRYSNETELDAEDIANQAIWMLKLDDSFQRAEMGVQQMTVDGVTILFRDKDNTVAPQLSQKHGIALAGGMRRRVGSYRIPADSTFRVPLTTSTTLSRQRK